jgi:hypothetical protein
MDDWTGPTRTIQEEPVRACIYPARKRAVYADPTIRLTPFPTDLIIKPRTENKTSPTQYTKTSSQYNSYAKTTPRFQRVLCASEQMVAPPWCTEYLPSFGRKP